MSVRRINTLRCSHALATLLLGFASAALAQSPQQHFQLGIDAQQHGDLATAEREFNAVIALDPGAVAAYENLGVIHLKGAQYEKAVEEFQSALRLDPQNNSAERGLGSALARDGQCHAAAPVLEKLGKMAAYAVSSHLLLGECEFQQGDYAHAATELEQVLAAGGGTAAIYYMDLKSCSQTPNCDGKSRFVEFQQRYSQSVEYFQLMAESLDHQQHYAEAITAARHALELAPDRPGLHLMLGILLGKSYKRTEACEEFRQELRISPRWDQPYLLLGREEIAQGKPQAAIPWLLQARELNPKAIETQSLLGEAFLDQEDWANAETSYRAVVKAQPESASAHYGLARALLKEGKKAEASRELALVRQIKEPVGSEMEDISPPVGNPSIR